MTKWSSHEIEAPILCILYLGMGARVTSSIHYHIPFGTTYSLHYTTEWQRPRVTPLVAGAIISLWRILLALKGTLQNDSMPHVHYREIRSVQSVQIIQGNATNHVECRMPRW